MRKIVFLSLITGLIALSSCHHDNKPGSLTLKFNPMFGSSRLYLNNTYQSPDGKYYNFSKLKLFLSHIKLVRTDASIVEVKSLAYLSLDDSTTLTIPLGDSVGSFTNVQFSIGVDSIQDNYDPTNPTNTDPSYPLNQADMFWSYSQKFVFIKMDVLVDTISNIPAQNGYPYHIGTSPYYTTVTLNKIFSVTGSSQSVITLHADFQRIFYGANAINPLVDGNTITTDSNDALAHKFMANLSKAFSLQ